jgi:transposase, IS5 family
LLQRRRVQPTLWHPELAPDIEEMQEPCRTEADRFARESCITGKRIRRARPTASAQPHARTVADAAEVALRLLILKPVGNWSYDELEREVRANRACRAFTRIGDGKVPDAKTSAGIGPVVGPEVRRDLHEPLVALAQSDFRACTGLTNWKS